MTSEIDRNSVMIADNGGSLDLVSGDGEILATIAVPAGKSSPLDYLELVPEGASLQAGQGVVILRKKHRIGIQAYGPGSHDSGANPDFRPTSASRLEREMRLTLSRMQQATSRVEARERALARVERIPTRAPAPEPEAEVIEDLPPEPAPEPEVKKASRKKVVDVE